MVFGNSNATEVAMSATLDSLAPHRWTTVRTGAVVNTIHQRPTAGSASGLREIAAEQAATLRAAFGGTRTVDTPTGRRAAAAVERVREHKARTAAAKPAPAPQLTFAEVDALLAQVPVGRYALPRVNPTPDNDITFFEVTEDRRGTRRIRRLLGSVGDFERQALILGHQFHAARHILEDVRSAAALYGKKSNACGFCAAKGRFSPLTHIRSRAAGYGQHCAEKHGLPW